MKVDFDYMRKNLSASYNELIKYLNHVYEIYEEETTMIVIKNDLIVLLNDLKEEIQNLNALHNNSYQCDYDDLSDIIKLREFPENE